MPLDAQGQYRHNDEAAQMHSKGKSMTPKAIEPHEDGGEHTEVHNHGDGTFHTVHGGEQTEHESIGHMHAHLSKIHGEEGHSHFHGHHDGISHKSHSAKSGEEPESREHDDMQGMHDHLDDAMGDGEEDHDKDPGEEEQGQGALAGLY